jgi:putative transcriptional regulator
VLEPRKLRPGELGNRVRKYRFLKNEMTQQELADAVRASRQTIHAIETGKFNPSVRLALKLASALDTSVAELFYLQED